MKIPMSASKRGTKTKWALFAAAAVTVALEVFHPELGWLSPLVGDLVTQLTSGG